MEAVWTTLKKNNLSQENYSFLYRPSNLIKKDITIEVPAGCKLSDPGLHQDVQLLTDLYGFFVLRTHENDALLDNRRFKEWRNQLHLLLGNQVRQPYSNTGKLESNENAVARKVLAKYGVDFKENDVLMMSNSFDNVKGNKYDSCQEIHQDSTFLKAVPPWVVFTVLQNAQSGGETRLASGQHLLNAMPLHYLVALKEADAITFFREGTDGHLLKPIINYDEEKRCITTGYRADGDVEYKCKNALIEVAMNWIWNFNKDPDNYATVSLEELRESLVVANLVAFHGREGFVNSETQVRKVLRWTFDNNTVNPLNQGIDVPEGTVLEKAVKSQNFETYLQQEVSLEMQREILSKLSCLNPHDYPKDVQKRKVN
ncbi:MAG: TauD/TfdA family dioxygenase [Potamolinea sp.]